MLNLNTKISKLSAYIVLLGYLTITTNFIFHHHNVEIGKLHSSLTSSETKSNNHLKLVGSEVLCAVQFAFNSLHNSVISFDTPLQDFQIKPGIIDFGLVSSKPTKETIFSFCLRAPPFSLS